MAGILSLSNELLMHMFSASLTVYDALRLSGTSHIFRAIWLEHGDVIIAGILGPQTPAYDDVVALTVIETRLLDDGLHSDCLSPECCQRLRFCLPRLLRNVELASIATAACAAWLVPVGFYRRSGDRLLSSPASYYFIRQLVLAFDHRQLRNSLYEKLRTALHEWNEHQYEFVSFLCAHADFEEQPLHGIPKSEEEWTDDDEMSAIVNVDKWEFALDILTAAVISNWENCPRRLDEAIQVYST